MNRCLAAGKRVPFCPFDVCHAELVPTETPSASESIGASLRGTGFVGVDVADRAVAFDDDVGDDRAGGLHHRDLISWTAPNPGTRRPSDTRSDRRPPVGGRPGRHMSSSGPDNRRRRRLQVVKQQALLPSDREEH